MLLLVILLALAELAHAQLAPVVELKGGKVQGLTIPVGSSGKVNFYQGIRFARAGRFEKPKPVEPWIGLHNATLRPADCPQFSDPTGKHELESEDCLHLNVWQPAETKANRSVMVWIYGGGFTIGSISQGYDARHLAQDGDVVVVCINYRLGPLGFLYHGAESVGNFAIYDQILGLEWVRDNIAQFGGNPNQVTIFGESAGSFSVGVLILSPLTKGLFHRAIMQSGAPSSFADSKESAQHSAEQFAQQLQCSPGAEMLKCLKEKSLDQLRSVRHTINRLVYADEVMPLKPNEAVLSGKFNTGLDLLFGLCDTEAAFFGSGAENVNTLKEAHDAIARHGNEAADFYLKQLPAEPTADQLKTLVVKAAGDSLFDCPTILFAEQIAKFSTASQRFYSYRLRENPRLEKIWQIVPHGTDIQYLFNLQLEQPNNQLSKDMIRAWTEFAKTGKTAKMGSAEWTEAFVNKAQSNTEFMSLNSSNYQIVKDFYKETCDTFWKPKILHI